MGTAGAAKTLSAALPFATSRARACVPDLRIAPPTGASSGERTRLLVASAVSMAVHSGVVLALLLGAAAAQSMAPAQEDLPPGPVLMVEWAAAEEPEAVAEEPVAEPPVELEVIEPEAVAEPDPPAPEVVEPPPPAPEPVEAEEVAADEPPPPPEPRPEPKPEPKPAPVAERKPPPPAPVRKPPAPAPALAERAPSPPPGAVAGPTPMAPVSGPAEAPPAQMASLDAGIPVVGMPDFLSPPRPPAYPRRARQRGYEGTVVVHALVTMPGPPHTAKVVQSSGYPSLDDAALDAVRTWSFRPALRNGQAVAAWVQVPVNFQLR